MFPTRLELEAHIAATHSGGKGGRISLQSFQSDRSAGGRRGPGPRYINFFGPFLAHFSARHNPTHAACYVLLSDYAHRTRIRA